MLFCTPQIARAKENRSSRWVAGFLFTGSKLTLSGFFMNNFRRILKQH